MSKLPYANKILGQHWLSDNNSLDTICSYAELSKDDIVIEIGPGSGTLTKKLLDFGVRVTAFEIDKNLVNQLKIKFASQIKDGSLTVILTDVRQFDFDSFKSDYKVVANIPYYLTSFLIRKLADSKNKPIVDVLLIQKEVAQRLIAIPGEMSLLSLSTQLNFTISAKEILPAYLFVPPPKVDSQIVVLKPYQTAIFSDINYQELIKFMTLAFIQKRKKIINSMSIRFSREDILNALLSLNLRQDIRPQDLSLDNWHKLYLFLMKI